MEQNKMENIEIQMKEIVDASLNKVFDKHPASQLQSVIQEQLPPIVQTVSKTLITHENIPCPIPVPSSGSNVNQIREFMQDRDVEQWPKDIEKLLYIMQVKSLELSTTYKTKYLKFQKMTDHFKIPIIVFSSIATFFNFGLQPYFSQQTIAIVCSGLTFVTGLLSTIELYLQIQKQMEKSLVLSKDLYMNSMDIYKILSLHPERREVEALDYLNTRYEMFRQIIEKSEIMPDNGVLPSLDEITTTRDKFDSGVIQNNYNEV
jgi:hypothetical protein